MPAEKSAISGKLHTGLAPFAACFASQTKAGAHGAGVAVYRRGACLARLYGGQADPVTGKAWEASSLASIYSCGKAVLVMLMACARQRGLLRWDDAIRKHWPAFALSGTAKAAITIDDVLTHRSGFIGFAKPIDPARWNDWAYITEAVERQDPPLPAGGASAYSPQLFGIILARLLEKLYGKPFAALLSDYTRAHRLALYCGLPQEELPRWVRMKKPPRPPELGPVDALKRTAFLSPWAAPARMRREDWVAACLPASNMVADAASLAKAVQPLACAGKMGEETVLRPEVAAEILSLRVAGQDRVLPYKLHWTRGLMRNDHGGFGPEKGVFGHSGFGGSVVMVDPRLGLSFAYVSGEMSPNLLGDPRPVALLRALYASDTIKDRA